MSESSYVISIGNERPQEVLVAYPKKDGLPDLTKYNSTGLIQVGKHFINNACYVWGRRLVDGKPLKSSSGDEIQIDFNTPNYKGELEFLPYNDPKGYSIGIRYLKRSRSLDIEYQEQVLKIKVDVEKGDDEAISIPLEAGQNKFDIKKDALFIQYLKVHPQNRDSKSKNPDPKIKGYQFFEVTEDNVNTNSIKYTEASLDAGFIVKSVSNKPADLKVLLKLIGKRDELEGIDNLSKDKQIYDALLRFAVNAPNDFNSIINDWKKTISEAFEKAKAFKALDLTKDGHISIEVGGKTNLVWSDLKGKGDNMIDWIMANYLDSENYKQTISFIEFTEKLK